MISFYYFVSFGFEFLAGNASLRILALADYLDAVVAGASILAAKIVDLRKHEAIPQSGSSHAVGYWHNAFRDSFHQVVSIADTVRGSQERYHRHNKRVNFLTNKQRPSGRCLFAVMRAR